MELEWAGINSPNIYPLIYGQLIYNKEVKNIQWRKDTFLNTWCCENWTATCKRMKFKHFITPHIQIKSKWFKNLSAKWHHKTRKKHTLFEISLNNIFLVLSPQARETKAKINKRDLIKTKSFYTTKEALKKSQKATYSMGDNICKQYVL